MTKNLCHTFNNCNTHFFSWKFSNLDLQGSLHDGCTWPKIKFTCGTVSAHKFLGMTVGGLDTASIPQASKKKKKKSIV
jgi:hypothetical protein